MGSTGNTISDPARTVSFTAGNAPAAPSGQIIDNPAARYSRFIDLVNPSGSAARRYVAGATAVRATAEAVQKRALWAVFALAFVSANVLVIRNVAQFPELWSTANPGSFALLYSFTVMADTLVFGVLGSVFVLACCVAVRCAQRLLK